MPEHDRDPFSAGHVNFGKKQCLLALRLQGSQMRRTGFPSNSCYWVANTLSRVVSERQAHLKCIHHLDRTDTTNDKWREHVNPTLQLPLILIFCSLFGHSECQ